MNYIDYVKQVYAKVEHFLPTLTASQYDYYKSLNMPTSKTIIRRVDKKWHEILKHINLHLPLSRKTLATLSQSLHLLEQKIQKILQTGWSQRNFETANKKYLRPDAYFVERMLLENEYLYLLDVKLCVSATTITVYKYLPLFEKSYRSSNKQLTFFDEWLPDTATEHPIACYDSSGQTNFAIRNNILYICYLIGKPRNDIFPCSNIVGKFSHKKKCLPINVEVRHISFFDLPDLYCNLSGVPKKTDAIASLLSWARYIQEIVLTLPSNAYEIGRRVNTAVKADQIFKKQNQVF